MATRSVPRDFSAILVPILMMAVMALAIAASTLTPARAYAADYDLWIAGTQVTSENAEDVFGDGTVKYDAGHETLYLENFVSTGQGHLEVEKDIGAVIYSDLEFLELQLYGNNALVPTADQSAKYGLYSAGKLTINGTGNLSVAGDVGRGSAGIYSKGDIWLCDGYAGVITAQGGDAVGGTTAGVIVEGESKSLAISNGTLVATGGHNWDYTESYVSAGVSAANVYVNYGALVAQGGRSVTSSFGINCVGLHANGGAIIARAGEALYPESDNSYGVNVGEKRRAIRGIQRLDGTKVVGKVGWVDNELISTIEDSKATGIVIVSNEYTELPQESDGGVIPGGVYRVTGPGDDTFTYDGILEMDDANVVFADLREWQEGVEAYAGVVFNGATIAGSGTVIAVGGSTPSESGGERARSAGLVLGKDTTVMVGQDDGFPTVVGVGGPVGWTHNNTWGIVGFSGSEFLISEGGNVVGVGGSAYNGSETNASVGIEDGIKANGVALIAGIGGNAASGMSIGIDCEDADGVFASESGNVLGVGQLGQFYTSSGITAKIEAQDASRVVGVAGAAGNDSNNSCKTIGILSSLSVVEDATVVGLGGIPVGADGLSVGIAFQPTEEQKDMQVDGNLIAAGRTKALADASAGSAALKFSKIGEARGFDNYEGTGSAAVLGDATPISDLEAYKRIEVKSELIKYNLWVAGVQVTNANADDVLGDGKVKYDAAQRTLYLNEAEIGTSGTSVVAIEYTNSDALTIDVTGACTVTGAGSSSVETAIALFAGMADVSVVLHDDAKLTVNGGDNDYDAGQSSVGVEVKSLALSGKGTMLVVGGAGNEGAYALRANDVLVCDQCELACAGGNYPEGGKSAGLVLAGGIKLEGSAKATFEGGTNGVLLESADDHMVRTDVWTGKMMFVSEASNSPAVAGLEGYEGATISHYAEECSMKGLPERESTTFTPYPLFTYAVTAIPDPVLLFEPYVELYTVSFNANGGKGTMESVQVEDGASYTLPDCTFTAPDGKEFDEWNRGAVGTTITVTGDVTLKALWKDKAVPPAPGVDKALLKAAIAAAKAAEEGVAVSGDGSDVDPSKMWVTAGAKDALDAAIADAGKVLADESATQAQVDAATADVKAAQAAFEAAEKPGAKKDEPGPGPEPVVDEPWTRLYGDNAFETMSAIIDEGGFTAGGTVVLASLEGYWDALTAAGIAGLEKAPVVMSLPEGLSPEATAQLQKLAPKRIVVCGGTYWLPDALLDEAKAAAGTSPEVVRLAGEVAVNTAEEIAKAGAGKWSDTAIVATVGTFQDALAAAPLAYAKAMPIYLAQFDFASEAGSLAQSTIESMKANKISKAYIAGGTYWLPEQVKKQLSDAGIEVVGQLMGETAVETSAAIAAEAVAELGFDADDCGVADARAWYDALASASFCGKNASVLLLAHPDNSSFTGFVEANADAIVHGFVFGGENSVPADTMAAAEAAAKGAAE